MPRPVEQAARRGVARAATRLGEPDRDVDRDDRVVGSDPQHGRDVAGDARLELAVLDLEHVQPAVRAAVEAGDGAGQGLPAPRRSA